MLDRGIDDPLPFVGGGREPIESLMTFSTKNYLNRKTGTYGVGRFKYLQTLVTEFQDTHKQGQALATPPDYLNSQAVRLTVSQIKKLQS